MNSQDGKTNGRARPPGAPKRPRRRKLPHERPLWLRPEDEIFFVTICCEPRDKNQLCYSKIARAIFDRENRAPRGGAPGGRALPLVIAALLFASCRPDMMNQPKAKALSESDFFSNGANARQPPAHTVARGDARGNTAFYTGQTNGIYVTQLPVKLTRDVMSRGRERFEAICAECHDRTGSGNGMVVQRGFPQPPSFHVDRLRNAPIGHFFDVITNGYGVMYSYATRVEPEDRWAIAAYIRALQLSHNAKPSDVDPGERAKLEVKK
jgi:mono/diheme cytochrome c family protein